MTHTKFIAAFLAVLFMLGTIAAGAEAYFNDFEKTEDNKELYKNVVLLYELGILKGYEESDAKGNSVLNIGLERNVTRAEMTAFIFRLVTSLVDKNKQGGSNKTTFTDLTENEWYVNYINYCVQNGIINGRDENTFDPNANVSFDEAIKMIVASLGYVNLDYPFGYNHTLRNLLVRFDKTLDQLIPNYKSDTAIVSYPATRKDIVNLLAFAFKAPMKETYTAYIDDSTMVPVQVNKVLADDIWKKANTSVETSSYLVMAIDGRALESSLATAELKDNNIRKNLYCVELDTNNVRTINYKYFTFEELGLKGDEGDYLGAKLTLTKITKADITGKAISYYVGPLNEILFAKEYKNVELAAEEITTGTDALKGNWLTVKTDDGKSERKKIADVNLYDVKARSNTIFDYTAVKANKTSVFTAIKAGAEHYTTVLDIFADGEFDYVNVAYKYIGLLGDEVTISSKVNTKIVTLSANEINEINTKANLKTLNTTARALDADIRNDCGAVKGDFFVYYKLDNKYIFVEKVSYVDGTVVKADQTSGKLSWIIALDQLGENGETINKLVTLPTDSTALLSNGITFDTNGKLNFSTTIKDGGSFITLDTKASFVIYKDELYAIALRDNDEEVSIIDLPAPENIEIAGYKKDLYGFRISINAEPGRQVEAALYNVNNNKVVMAYTNATETETPGLYNVVLIHECKVNSNTTYIIRARYSGQEAYTQVEATTYDNTQDNADIAAAKLAIESATYISNHFVISNDSLGVLTASAVASKQVNALGESLHGAKVHLVCGTLTAAIAGTVADADGTNGTFTFTVQISKGFGNFVTTATLTMVIKAIPYNPYFDNAEISAARYRIQGKTYTATQAEAETTEAALIEAQAQVDAMGEELYGTTATVVTEEFTAAVEGTAIDTDGTNGTFTFTVTIAKGLGTTITTITLAMEIIATTYQPS
ncbi:MAG: S-layer homology domain-containing protein [Oscillospiraceae bacterium]|nr:S-layer homology domain-containing protein [Oscillospiraceae bacterium]